MIAHILRPFRSLRHAIGRRLRRRLAMRPRKIPPAMDFARFKHGYEIALYFPDGPANLYQLSQWIEPLEVLAEDHPTLIVARSHASFQRIQQMTSLPAVFVRRVGDLDSFVSDGNLKVAMYVNHARSNFQMLRYGSMLHVHIGHGESEKASMASHQIRAYDYAFVAGTRAIARYESALLEFPPALRERMIQIGRPQRDVRTEGLSATSSLPTILYAPTWEGDRETMRYSSVGELGVRVVSEILHSREFRLIYRPHPRTGAYEEDVREGDREIRRLIEEANEVDPSIGHMVDVESSLYEQIDQSAVGIADVSAVTLDLLASSRPVFVTDVADRLMASAESQELHDVCYRIGVDSESVVALLQEAVTKDPMRSDRIALAEEYFGDLSSGSSMDRFVQATESLIRERDRLAAKASGESL